MRLHSRPANIPTRILYYRYFRNVNGFWLIGHEKDGTRGLNRVIGEFFFICENLQILLIGAHVVDKKWTLSIRHLYKNIK